MTDPASRIRPRICAENSQGVARSSGISTYGIAARCLLAKSGLNISGREGLQDLIRTVQSGNAPFDVILVCDVSRWGRFQDADESAYYDTCARKKALGVVVPLASPLVEVFPFPSYAGNLTARSLNGFLPMNAAKRL